MNAILTQNVNETAIGLGDISQRQPRRPRRRKAVRVSDVARVCGFSTATVSMVLNANPRISAATQKRVRRVIDQLGYRPSRAAQMLASRQSAVLVVLLPSNCNAFADPHIGEMINGICEQATAMKRTIVFERAPTGSAQAGELSSLLYEHGAEGMLLMGSSIQPDLLENLGELRDRVVVVENPACGRAIDSVAADERGGAQQVMNCLSQLGHRKIALVVSSNKNCADAVDVYRAAMSPQGHHLVSEWIVDGLGAEAGSAEAVERLLDKHPEITAVFALSDRMAIGALHGAQAAGLNVPGDVSVVGFDDLRSSAFLNPALTTVRLPLREMGAIACRRMVERIEGRETAAVDRLPTHLVLRSSTALARNIAPSV